MNPEAISAAARAMYQIEWASLDYDKQPQQIQDAWKELATVGLEAAAPHLSGSK